MRRDLLITALIFSIVGFIAGALFTGAIGGAPSAVAVTPPARPPAGQTAAISEGGLPEGHPPMDLATRWQELRERAEADPKDAAAALELANFLFDQGAWDQAAIWYKKTLALGPDDTDVRTDYATSLYNSNRADDAVREYNAVLKAEPDKPQALYWLARAMAEKQGDFAGAEKILARLRRAHPDFEGIGLLESLLKDLKDAE